jgi:hypothetical protein
MIAVSEAGVRYARNGDVHLAYRVLGGGEIPLVIVPGWISNVDLWDDPSSPAIPSRLRPNPVPPAVGNVLALRGARNT